MAYGAGQFVRSFNGWSEVSGYIIDVARELEEAAQRFGCDTVEARRAFVLGGLEALNKTQGWDMLTQPEEMEEDVLAMFVQILIR